jgi:hypothetical protein
MIAGEFSSGFHQGLDWQSVVKVLADKLAAVKQQRVKPTGLQ